MQALRRLVGAGICANVCGQSLDLLLRFDQLISQHVQGFARGNWQTRPVTGREQAPDIVNAFGNDDAEFTKMSPHGVHDLGLLADEEFPPFVGHQKCLCFLSFHGHKTHGGP